MHFAKPPSDHIRQLAERVANGTFTDDDVRELEAAIASNAADRAFYLEYCQLHADLQLIMTAERATERVREGMQEKTDGKKREAEVADAQCSPADPQVARGDWAHYFTHHNVGVGVAAGLLFVTAVLVWSAVTYLPRFAKTEEETAKKVEHVAVLSGRQSVVWLDQSDPPADRPQLAPGQRLTIKSGLIEIVYLTGVHVVIEGPADFTIGKKADGTKAQRKTVRSSSPDSSRLDPNSLANSGFLRSGKLVARVAAPTAVGFTIDTPQARVVDLGTEFGVEVEASGTNAVTVFEGSVEVGVGSYETEPIVLTKGHSLRVAPDGQTGQALPTVGERFVRKMPASRREFDPQDAYVAAVKESGPVAYWRFEDPVEGQIVNTVGNAYPLRIVGDVVSRKAGDQNSAASFRRGGRMIALVCDGVRSIYAGDYTFEAWFQSASADHSGAVIASATLSERSSAMLCSLRGTRDAQSKQFKIRYLHRSPPGASGGRDLFSQSRIWTDRWYHVATVRKDDVTSLWIDGKMESTTQGAAPIQAENLKLVIGQLFEPNGQTKSGTRPFLGLLDEIALYDRALTPDEIRRRVDLAYPK